MRRLPRRAFNVLAAVSMLLFVATCVPWAGGLSLPLYRRANTLGPWPAIPWERELWWGGGLDSFALDPPAAPTQGTPAARLVPTLHGVGGFRWGSQPLSLGGWIAGDTAVVAVASWWAVPPWAVGAATAILPAAWLVLAVRRRRPRPGLCRSCGYDLRATPDGSALLTRCPECGRRRA